MYLLIISDVMKRSSSTFYVPRDFKIGEIHFMSTPLAPLRLLDWFRVFGDDATSIGAFRYRGKDYVAEDYCDAGSYDDASLPFSSGTKRRNDTTFSQRCSNKFYKFTMQKSPLRTLFILILEMPS